MDTISRRVKTIIADELGLDLAEVTDDARLGEQLHADSLDSIELTLRLEEEFAIEIPDEDAEQLQRVSQVIAYITAHAGTATA